MTRTSEAGLTLIEVLIAVTLLSLLSVGMLTAMHLGLRTMDQTDARMVRNRRVTGARNVLENELNGFIDTIAIAPALNNSLVPFLEAEPNTMRFVTSFSLEEAWRGRPQIAELQVTPGERGEGVRLIVNETPYTGQLQAGQYVTGRETDEMGRVLTRYAPVIPGPGSFVVADRLSYCRFIYLERRQIAPFEIWQPLWSNYQAYPAAVRIEMASLDHSPAELHVSTVTVPIKITAPPGMTYAGS